ncbi:MAG: hypothetical protein Q4G59_00025 [Planctomycetia bacterium]|nr:hypothetical protein [Planctomycetia bacterium]
MQSLFQCGHCGASLQIDDTNRGFEVLCPMCGKATTVPVAEAISNTQDESSGVAVEIPSSGMPDMNPYAPPACLAEADAVPFGQGDWDMFPVRVHFAEMFCDTFRLIKRCFLSFFLLSSCYWIVGWVNNYCLALAGLEYWSLVSIAFILLNIFIGFAVFQYLIRAALAGRPISPRNFYVPIGLFFRAIGATIFFYLFVLLVTILALCFGFWFPGAIFYGLVATTWGNEIPLVVSIVFGALYCGWIAVVIISCIRFTFSRCFYLSFLLDKQPPVFNAFDLSKKYTDKNLDTFILGSLIFVLPFVILMLVVNVLFVQGNIVQDPFFNSWQLFPILLDVARVFLFIPVMNAFFIVFYLHMTNRKVGFLANSEAEDKERDQPSNM